MPIKPHNQPKAAFSVANQFPEMPKFPKLSEEENAALQQWHTDMLQVFTRQFNAISSEIDNKVDKP